MGINRRLESEGRGTGPAPSSSPEAPVSLAVYGSVEVHQWRDTVVMKRTYYDGVQETLSVTHQKFNAKMERLFNDLF